MIALAVALVVPSSAMALLWANETALRDTPEGVLRDTFVYNPGVGDEIHREEFVQSPLFGYYMQKEVGFDANFLTWARVQELNVGSSKWSGCKTETPHSEPCPFSSVKFGTVGEDVAGPITVLYWKGAFIATACGNFSPGGGAGPIPRITGVKYEDLNANGKRDPEDPGLPGWTIKLLYEGKEVASTTTAANGSYSFNLDADHLPIGAGTYKVEEVQKAGWFASQAPGAINVPLGAEEKTFSGQDFGNYRPAKIEGHKFDDSNVNGLWDPLENGLAKWQISLSNEEQKFTDPEGAYSFSVRPGTYTVSEQLQEGWRQTDPGGEGARKYTLISGQEVKNADFGNVCLGDVSVEPVDDSTGEPVPMEVRLEEGEVPGILENEPSLPRTMTGTPTFGELLPGTYRVVAFLPEGVFTTDPDVVPVEGRFAIVKEVTVSECESTPVPLHLFTASTPGKVTGGVKIEVPEGFATSGFVFMTREEDVPHGILQYNDHALGLNLHTWIIKAIHVEGEEAVIWGEVPVGESLEIFELRLVDAGEPGVDDRYALTLADGYTAGKDETIVGGNVQIHK
ncbi:MAG: SdrD B-like domain-containing protein [Chloroflexota bacterium]